MTYCLFNKPATSTVWMLIIDAVSGRSEDSVKYTDNVHDVLRLPAYMSLLSHGFPTRVVSTHISYQSSARNRRGTRRADTVCRTWRHMAAQGCSCPLQWACFYAAHFSCERRLLSVFPPWAHKLGPPLYSNVCLTDPASSSISDKLSNGSLIFSWTH